MARKRSAQGMGGPRERSDGRWEYRYTENGERKSLYGSTQKEVKEKYKNMLADKKNGQYVDPSRLTVGAWLDTWQNEYLADKKESTQASYKGQIKNHIAPKLGAVPLQQLTPDAVQHFVNELSKSNLSAKSVKNVHGVLHSALEQAVEDGKISKNPCDKRKLPRVQKKEIKVMDSGVVEQFLQAIQGHKFETIYFFDLFTGLRQAEVLGLTWDCIDTNH